MPTYYLTLTLTLTHHPISFVWVKRPERPKVAKDEVKRSEEPPARSWGPEGSKTSNFVDDYDGGYLERATVVWWVPYQR